VSTGPITFANETARKQLIDEGEVVTFRRAERTRGKTWWRRSRTGPKQGEVVVEHIGKVDPSDTSQLEPYVTLSGFTSAREWQSAIEILSGGLEHGHLYRVRSLSEGEQA
jgi:hypothetical protein